MIGKIIYNTILGVITDTKQFYKIKIDNLGSKVLDGDIVEFTPLGKLAIIIQIISKKKQYIIGEIDNKELLFPLHNPFYKISYPNSIKTRRYNICFISNEYSKPFIIQEDESIQNLIINYIQYLLPPSYLTTKSIDNQVNYIDLTDHNTFHVDPEGCEDVDDYISYTDTHLYIHIIDLTKYIEIGCDEDKKALRKSQTLYLPYYNLHLNETNIFKRDDGIIFCISLEVNLDTKEVRFINSKVKCKKSYTYGDFEQELCHLPLNIIDFINEIEIGKSNVGTKTVIWKMNDKGKVYPKEFIYGKANEFIAKLAIFYNTCLTEKFNIPQRFHPEEGKLAFYSEEKGHVGLQRKSYTHGTSPIRRYFDRIIQNIVNQKIKYEEVSQDVLNYLNEMNIINKKIVKWITLKCCLEYINDNIERIWEGKYIGYNTIHIENIDYKIYLRSLNSLEIGEQVFIKILKLDFNHPVVELLDKNLIISSSV